MADPWTARRRVRSFARVGYARLATVSETVSDSESDDNDTGIIHQGIPSSDDRCDLNCVVSTGT